MVFRRSCALFLAVLALGVARRHRAPFESYAWPENRRTTRESAGLRLTTIIDSQARRVNGRDAILDAGAAGSSIWWLRGGASEEGKKLKPFTRGKANSIVVDKSIEKVLAEGNIWQVPKVAGNMGSGRAVMDVKAPPKVVWKQILDFSTYPKKAPKLKSCQVYKKRSENFGTIDKLWVKFVSPIAPGFKLTYHIYHTYEPLKKSITWTLDDEKENDFIDVQGHWHVEPHGVGSRVFYEIKTIVPSWIPGWLKKTLTNKAMTDATSWLKRESEKAHLQSIRGGFGNWLPRRPESDAESE